MNGIDDRIDDRQRLDEARVHTAHRDTFAADHLPPRDQWPEFRFDLP